MSAKQSSKDFYAILMVSHEASADDIRRAYRILARRYHPDVNPGAQSDAKFREISDAYHVLSDPKRRQQYDTERRHRLEAEFHRQYETYVRHQREADFRRRQQAAGRGRSSRPTPPSPPPPPGNPVVATAQKFVRALVQDIPERISEWRGRNRPKSGDRRTSDAQLQTRRGAAPVVQLSLSFGEAVQGGKKETKVSSGTGLIQSITFDIPKGVRPGTVLRAKTSLVESDEVIAVIRVVPHPFLALETRGVTLQVPVTVHEILSGASITVPTFDEPMVVTIPRGAQSGTEICLQGKGIQLEDGTKGDLFLKLMVRVPESPEAVGLKDKAKELEPYYEQGVRSTLPGVLSGLG